MTSSAWSFVGACGFVITGAFIWLMYEVRRATVSPPASSAADAALVEDALIAELDALYYDVPAFEGVRP